MQLAWPWVSRRAYDMAGEALADAAARYAEAMTWNRALVQQIVDLKKDNFVARPSVAPRPQQPPPQDIEDIARAGATREAISRMTADYVRAGVEPSLAEREAKKLIGELSTVMDLD